MLPILRTFVALLLCGGALLADWTTAQQIVTEGDQNSRFGYSLAVAETYAAVGAPDENFGAGAVYVFKKDAEGAWMPFQTIENVTTDDGGGSLVWYEFQTLGWDVALDESGFLSGSATLVIGAPQSRRAQQIVTIHGTYIEYSPESGTLVYRLNAEKTAFDFEKEFRGDDHNDTGLVVGVADTAAVVDTQQSGGLTVPVVGILSTVVAGHPNDNRVTTYVNRVGGSEWRELLSLEHIGTGDRYGESLAIDGDMSHLLVGAPYQDLGEYPDKGAVYFYKLTGTWADDDLAWSDEQSFHQSTSGIVLANCRFSHDSHFGIAVDLRNDRAIVGARKSSVECRPTALSPYTADGLAYTYALADTDGNSWSLMTAISGSGVDSQNDGFGLSVAIAGNLAVVGAPTYTDSKQTGAAFLYEFNGVAWSEIQSIVPATDGTFGNDVAISAGQLFLADEENDELSVFEYVEPVESNFNPALLMYLLN